MNNSEVFSKTIQYSIHELSSKCERREALLFTNTELLTSFTICTVAGVRSLADLDTEERLPVLTEEVAILFTNVDNYYCYRPEVTSRPGY
jgi:hypothetical protein